MPESSPLMDGLSRAGHLAPVYLDACATSPPATEVLEAMAAGVPVLASAVGGVPDLIEHEVNGLLCDPDRSETFAAAVQCLLDDRSLAMRLATEARRQAGQRFHPKVIAARHLEIYREIIAVKKRPS